MHLGEWLEPEEFQDRIAAGHHASHMEECTAYLYFTMKHMASVAEELGEKSDAELFAEYRDGAKKAYQTLFLKDKVPDTDRQAKLVRPLAFGIAEDKEKESLEQRLAQAVENRRYRIGTGFLSTPFILKTLSNMGREDLAYKMLENEEQPGWLYEVRRGATTVWENWEGTLSQNHYSPGTVCQWLFDTVAGISVDGENHFIIRPIPGGTLKSVHARWNSIYGNVESSWKKKKDGITEYMVVIPPNTTAEIIFRDGSRRIAEAGTYVYQTTKSER